MNVDLTKQEIEELIKQLGDHYLNSKLRRVLEEDPAKKSYPITSVAKADLEEKFHPTLVALLDNNDMDCIADQMAESYCESQQFWLDMENCAESFIGEKEKQFINNIPRHELPLHIDNDWFTEEGKALIEKRLKE